MNLADIERVHLIMSPGPGLAQPDKIMPGPGPGKLSHYNALTSNFKVLSRGKS